jgi:hypothetical protein
VPPPNVAGLPRSASTTYGIYSRRTSIAERYVHYRYPGNHLVDWWFALPAETCESWSRIKLMFLTDKGPVLGAAELLSPVSSTRQPFRFVALAYTDRRRLRAITQDYFKAEAPKQRVQSSRIGAGERQWIEKYQAAVGKLALAALILAIVGLSSVLYLLSLHFN